MPEKGCKKGSEPMPTECVMKMLVHAMQAWLVHEVHLWLGSGAEWRLDVPAGPPPESTPALLCCLAPPPLPLACKETINETPTSIMQELR